MGFLSLRGSELHAPISQTRRPTASRGGGWAVDDDIGSATRSFIRVKRVARPLKSRLLGVGFAQPRKDHSMAKKQSGESVYRIVDVVGVSEKSWEDAGRRAIETAATSLRDLRVAEVTQMDMKVEDGKVTAFRTRVALSFKYEG